LDLPAGARASGWFEPISGYHALGWVILGVMVMLSGVLFLAHLWEEREIHFTLSSALTALGVGFVPALALGLYQSAGHSAFLNSLLFRDTGRVNGTFADPNAFAMALALVLPLFVGFCLTKSGTKRFRMGLGVLSLGLGFLLFHTGTRSALLALVVAGIVGGGLWGMRGGAQRP